MAVPTPKASGNNMGYYTSVNSHLGTLMLVYGCVGGTVESEPILQALFCRGFEPHHWLPSLMKSLKVGDHRLFLWTGYTQYQKPNLYVSKIRCRQPHLRRFISLLLKF
ncbi:synaptotagmin 9 [Plakobranchus ocellatus]|uniref:Synaptotagmin 9 n=1 Tax=Plakobranchus ocellatus TaxID=259542 RepID=A0AAV4B4T5_9GAST|nr:synaptotagmin 9 [Plakobranchus ocellatus]